MVIGSQCRALGKSRRLSFLPQLARDLYETLVDPQLGGCEPALPDRPGGGLLQDPTRQKVVDALTEAFIRANAESATLLVAALGHGLVKHGDFFYLSHDGPGNGDLDRDVFFSPRLKHLLADSSDLNGLIVWLDTCHSGEFARQAATEWGEVGLGRFLRRYEMLSATDHRAAYRGDFTQALIKTLRRGIISAGETLDANDLREPLREGAQAQRPQRATFDGGGWAPRGDKGLWLAYNVRRPTSANAAPTIAAQTRVIELTDYLQPTDTLDTLIAGSQAHPCVILTGPCGSGKSTLAAALMQPAAAIDHVPADFVHAIAFATATSTTDLLATALANWLRRTVDGFTQAVTEFDKRLAPATQKGLSALETRVLGPLRLMKRRAPVRLVIDAFDQPPLLTRQLLLGAVADGRAKGSEESESPEVRFVLTARSAATYPPNAYIIEVARPGDDEIREYLHRREVPGEHIDLLVKRADGNWLHAYLLAEQAIRPGFDPLHLVADLKPSLAELYGAELRAAGAEDQDRWKHRLRPVLAVCAAAGVGPALPLTLAVAASAHLGGPRTSTSFLDSVVRLSGLIIRARPGQPEEHLGIFHLSLRDDYLFASDPEMPFRIDRREAHRALAEALNELAPASQHDSKDPVHIYALRAEPEHLWALDERAAVVNSLISRRLDRPADELERWQRWKARLDDRGSMDPITLIARSYVAHFTRLAGDPASARDQFKALLRIRKKVYKPTDPEILVTRMNLAQSTGEAGQPATARDQYAELLPAIENAWSPTHWRALDALGNLAYFTGQAGHPVSAREQYAALLALRKKAPRARSKEGRDSILVTRANLARYVGEAGDPRAARDQYAALIPMIDAVLGPRHPDTMAARQNLARFVGEAGDPAPARNQFDELLPVRIEVSGPTHPDTLTVRANLARFVGEAGDPEAARDQYTALLPDRRKASGPNHPATLDVRAFRAYFTGEAGDPAGARRQLRKLLPIRVKISGSMHPSTLTVRSYLARFVGEAGDPAAACGQFAALLPNIEEVLGPRHPLALTARSHWARFVGEAGDPVAACDQFAALIPNIKDALGSRHPDTLAARVHLRYWTAIARKAEATIESIPAAPASRRRRQ